MADDNDNRKEAGDEEKDKASNKGASKNENNELIDKDNVNNKGASKNGNNELTDKVSNKSVGKNKSGSGTKTTAGAKLKMPVTQLQAATRAQNRVKELQEAGSVPQAALDVVNKFKKELNKLIVEVELIKALDDEQQAAKVDWIEKNVIPKQNYMEKLNQALKDDLGVPSIIINDDQMSSVSVGVSEVSRLNAEYAVLQLERERMLQRRKQQEAERKLRQKKLELEEEERRLKEQREQEDLEARIEQTRLRQEVLERGSRASSVRTSGRRSARRIDCSPSNLPYQRPRVQNWLEAPVTNNHAEDLQTIPRQSTQVRDSHGATALPELLQNVMLPKITLPTFKGDLTEYMWFIRAFELHVEDVTADPARRLHLLLQHLEGDAHSLVLGCQLASDPATGYLRAKSKLQKEYGNPVKQTLAFKQRLLAWPTIKKDAADLKGYLTQLQLCGEIKANGHMPELDSSTILVQLAQKLPHRLQEGWQKRVCKIEDQRQCEATFKDFVVFTKEQSDAINHPVFGRNSMINELPNIKSKVLATSTRNDSRNNDFSSASYSNSASSSTPRDKEETIKTKDAFNKPCLLCKENHKTTECDKTLKDVGIEGRKEALRGLCFGCLRSGHSVKYCRSKQTCSICNRKHPTILHDPSKVSTTKAASQETEKKETEKNCFVNQGHRIAEGVVPIKVWFQTPQKSIIIKAILDNGSTSNFIAEDLVAALGLSATSGKIELATMTSSDTLLTKIVHGLKVADLDNNNVFTLGTTYVVPTMPITSSDLPGQEQVAKWPHLLGVPFDWTHDELPVQLLIGQGEPRAIAPQELVEGAEENQPYAVRTRLGWTINGPINPGMPCKHVSNFLRANASTDSVEGLLHRLYQHDFQDAYNFVSKGPSLEDKEWVRLVANSITHCENGQYQIALPFRTANFATMPPLQDNRAQALRRLNSLRQKFKTNPTFQRDYAAFIKKMEEGGYVEEVQEHANHQGNTVAYVPHHGVYHPRKPGKIRVVFNCSSRYQGVSLNDHLLQGPDLTNSLVGVLIRFRQDQVAFMADIESMFYRVLVPEDQRDALRYLWWPEGETDKPEKTYRLKVHLFGALSSPSCANYALQQAAKDAQRAGLVTEDVCNAVLTNFYVDDCLKSTASVKDAVSMAQGLIAACRYGGFKLSRFVSTSTEVLKKLNKEYLAPALNNIDFNQENKTDPLGALAGRALGVSWQISKDEFFFKVAHEDSNDTKPVTRRRILSTLSTLYDPLGFAAPVTVKARMMFRSAIRRNLNWDEDLTEQDEDLHREWLQWKEQLPRIQEISIPRCIRPAGQAKPHWQLHIFCDASLEAYAAVAYLRQEISNKAHVAFVFGKARVSPPKTVTVPRMELVAAKLAVDIASMIQQELSPHFVIQKRHFWSDSQTVLKYLTNTKKRFHTFVANRVCAILEASTPQEWKFVPTELNPADEGTRGAFPHQLKEGRWLIGPNFLCQDEMQWPCIHVAAGGLDEDPEVRTLLSVEETKPTTPFVERWALRYSSICDLKRAAAVLINSQPLSKLAQ